MKISIVVPAFNEERLLGASLACIRSATGAFARLGWATELIVCDNNSTDRTADVARAAGATVVFEPVNQIARARNRGAAAATGDWLLFVDADSHPGAELFSEVAAHILSGRCLAGGCTVRPDRAGPILHSLTAFWNFISRALRWMAGSFIFCDAAAFRKIGGFSQEFFVGEEVDLSKRFKRLARVEKKKIIILHRHPILTSARKAQLYSLREFLRLLMRLILTRGKAAGDPVACHPWYDGRR